MKNKIASIQNRLKNYSKAQGKIHQFTLIRYFQERLLYRLSTSKYREKFLLKGGALVYALQRENSRNTLDIDLLARQIRSEGKVLIEIFKEIAGQDFDDGVIFDLTNISASEIIKEGNYSGVRIKIPATLGKIRQSMQIDIGFGDTVTPGPIEMIYPTLLEMNTPDLLAYSIETLIAEKFHAMIDLADYNTRMKDFYDIYTILKTNPCSNDTLKAAIKNTFEKRNTQSKKDHTLFQKGFYQNEGRIKQWTTFLKKSKLNEDLLFSKVMQFIKKELEPIYLSLIKQGT